MKKTMKARNIILTSVLGLVLLSTSCSDGFDAINTNPNEITEEQYYRERYKSELGSLLRKGATLEGVDVHQRIKALYVDAFAHYVAGNPSRNYTLNDEYQTKYWNVHYRWLASLNQIIEQCKDDPFKVNSVALSRIWRVYIQSQATDLFGPIPFPKSPSDAYSEYTALKDQYNFFFIELDEAIKQFDLNKEFLTTEDNIYWGNITKWKRFANTLRLRLAVKLSEIDPALCKTQAQAAVDASEGILQFEDNARISGTSSWGDQYPYFMYQIEWADRQVMITSMEKVLTNIGGIAYTGTAANHPAKVDPRGTRMFDTSVQDTIKNRSWKGLAPGLQILTDAMKKEVSAMSQTWIIPNNGRNTDIFLYAEACFLAAEAVERGFASTGTSKDWYEKGIKASFENLSLPDSLATVYLASADKNLWGTSANFDDAAGEGNTKLEKIITQKYIASYPDISYQAWNDKRRLNLPAFDIPEYIDGGSGTYPSDGNIKNPDNYISRIIYPGYESKVNEKNYDTGVAQLKDGDKTSSPLWWASKRSNYCTSAGK